MSGRIHLAAIVLGCGALAQAQYVFDSWTTENGLPHNSVRAVLQAQDGYLWLTTGGGLVRFDGVAFHVFNHSNTPQIPTNEFTFHTLLEDKQGGLWAGTAKGAIRYRNGVFTAYTTRDGLPADYITRIDQDAEGAVWIFTTHGLAKWKDGHLIRIAPQPGSEFNSVLTPPVDHVGHDAQFTGLWRMTRKGWERFAYGRWQQLPLPSSVSEPSRLRIVTILEDSKGRLWFSLLTNSKDFYCVEDGKLSIFPMPAGFQAWAGWIGYLDGRGFAWATNHQRRSVLIKGGTTTRVDAPGTTFIFTALEDREGSIWIGTLDKGLFRARPQVVRTISYPGMAETNFIRCLLKDRAGAIWFGSLGLYRLYKGRFERISVSHLANLFDTHNQVNALYEDADGTMIVGTWAGAVRLRRHRVIRDSLLSQLSSRVNAIHRDRRGALWLGASDGLYVFRSGQMTRYTRADGLPADQVFVFLEDHSATMWAGTARGLCRVENRVCKGVPYTNGLESSSITALYQDDEGVIWIGTYESGLFRVSGDKVTQYTTENGLVSDSAFSILEDNNGFLWIGCSIGIYRVRKQELNDFTAGRISAITSIHFGKSDGLASAESDNEGHPAGFRAEDGRLWFATTAGLAVVDPSAMPVNPNPQPVAIEEIRLEGNPIGIEKVVLPPDNHDLEIKYTALSLIKSQQIRFRYKLSDADRDWVEAGTRRTAYYSHLQPGTYRFEVMAANRDGVWSAQAATFSLKVRPPFYATWWFRMFLAMVLVGAAAAAWRIRTRHWERKQTLQRAVSRQIIASQENDRKRIAAELHDSLAQRLIIIKNTALLNMQSGNADGKNGALEEITSEASAAINEVREISYNLRPYQLDRLGLTKAIESVIRKAGSAAAVRFSTHLANIDEVLPKDAQINFYRVVQECLNNIVKHSGATQAAIEIERDHERLIMKVTDNGHGFVPEAAEAHAGFGLMGLSERVQLMSGTTEIRSSPGCGTEIRIQIDAATLRNEHYDSNRNSG